jgi:predicted metalloprotease|tara:strand:+ start:678 stop:911 length:234 start_codon:yes stop_codon:yes gene_type:complete
MNKAAVDHYRDEMIERMTRLEERHQAHFEVTKEIRVDVKSQNGRVRHLENKQQWFTGILATVTFVFSSLIAWIKGAS